MVGYAGAAPKPSDPRYVPTANTIKLLTFSLINYIARVINHIQLYDYIKSF